MRELTPVQRQLREAATAIALNPEMEARHGETCDLAFDEIDALRASAESAEANFENLRADYSEALKQLASACSALDQYGLDPTYVEKLEQVRDAAQEYIAADEALTKFSVKQRLVDEDECGGGSPREALEERYERSKEGLRAALADCEEQR